MLQVPVFASSSEAGKRGVVPEDIGTQELVAEAAALAATHKGEQHAVPPLGHVVAGVYCMCGVCSML